MVIMLVQPPAVTEAKQKIRVQQPEDFVACRAAENFLMPGVMNDKAELREDEGEERGIAKFDPEIIVEFGDQHESAGEHSDVEEHFANVIRGLLGHQAALPHQSQQIAEFVARRRSHRFP